MDFIRSFISRKENRGAYVNAKQQLLTKSQNKQTFFSGACLSTAQSFTALNYLCDPLKLHSDSNAFSVILFVIETFTYVILTLVLVVLVVVPLM